MKLTRWKNLFKEYSKISFESLSQEVKEDIASELSEKYKDFKDTTKFWNLSDIIEFIEDTSNISKLELKQVSPESLYKQFKNRKTSKSVVEKYKKMIQSGTEFDPVIINGKKFIDGGHRVQAYYELNKPSIDAVDVQSLFNYNWKKEIEDSF